MHEIVVSSPGKIILHGEHAVVYGKTALATCLNLRTYMRVKPCFIPGKIKIDLPDINKHLMWDIKCIKDNIPMLTCDPLNPSPPSKELLIAMADFVGIDENTQDTKLLALMAFLYLLSSFATNDIPPLHITVISKLPVSSGLGSSAGYSSCLAAALLLQSNHISVSSSGDWSDNDLDLINKWAFQAEKIIHGNPSGIDNSVCTYGGALRFQKGSHIEKLKSVPQLRILLVDTKSPRSTKALVAAVANKMNKYPHIIAPIMDSMEAISQKCQETFEDANLLNTKEMYKILEDLIDINQCHLRTIGVSHPSIDKICETSLQYGLHSKLTGAGGGGCVFTLIPPSIAPSVVNSLKERLEEVGFPCWETSLGGYGVRQHTATDKLPNFDDVCNGTDITVNIQ